MPDEELTTRILPEKWNRVMAALSDINNGASPEQMRYEILDALNATPNEELQAVVEDLRKKPHGHEQNSLADAKESDGWHTAADKLQEVIDEYE